MSYSRQQAVSDGTLQTLDISISYFKRTDLSVLLDDVLTTDWAWVGTLNTIHFTDPVPLGVTVTVVRATQSNKIIHEFMNGAAFTSRSMDEDFRQVLYLAQEYTEGAGFKDLFNDLDMHGFRITNLGNPINPSDAVSLQAMNTEYAGITAIANNALNVASIADAKAVVADAKAVAATAALYRAGAVGDGVTNDTAAVLSVLNTYGTCWLPENGKFAIQGLIMPVGSFITGPGELVGMGGATPMATLSAKCTVGGTHIDTRGSTYGFILDGADASVTGNVFRGDTGHYTFASNNRATVSLNLVVPGYSQTTPFLFAAGSDFACDSNILSDTTGFGISVRYVTGGSITNNVFRQRTIRASITSTAGQTVFVFPMGLPVYRYGIQINGAPRSTGVTASISPDLQTVTFTVAAGVSLGAVVEILAYRALENININSRVFNVKVSDNYMIGTGDSGIVIGCDYHNGVLDPNNVVPADFPAYVSVTGNRVAGAAYAGIAQTHAAVGCTFSGNTVTDCGQITQDQSYSSGLFISGADTFIEGNTFLNTLQAPTMRFGIVMGGFYTSTQNSPVARLGVNNFVGTFEERVFITNQTAGKRKQAIQIAGDSTPYPGVVDTDTVFSVKPANTPMFTYFNAGGGVARDTTNKIGGTASMATIVGGSLDIVPTAGVTFTRTVMRVNFWAKAQSGASFARIYSTLAGGVTGVSIPITDTTWQQYTMWFPVTPGIDVSTVFLRVGSDGGVANIQYVTFSSVPIP